MGVKHSKDRNSANAGDERGSPTKQNTAVELPKQQQQQRSSDSDEINSGGNNNSSSSPKLDSHKPTSQLSYGGAFIGVSTPFDKGDTEEKEVVLKKAKTQRSKNNSNRMIVEQSLHAAATADQQQEQAKLLQQQASQASGRDRQAYLQRLGIHSGATMSNEQAKANPMQIQQSSNSTREVIARQQTFSATMINDNDIKLSEVGIGQRQDGSVLRRLQSQSIVERQMLKHSKTIVVNDEPSQFEKVENDEEQKQGLSKVIEEDYPDQMLQLSESLFADKIKMFKPVTDEYEPDEAQDDVEDIFNFTEIGSTNTGQDNPDNTTPIEAEGTLRRDLTEAVVIPDDNRQEGFRLDQLSRDRTGDKLRKNLLSKLTYEKIWLTPQEKPKSYETAIIFDWDDTLLCTSFINPSGVYQHVELGQTVQQHIKLLEVKAKQMLEVAVTYGRVYIITNAAEGWVEFSAKKFMPQVVPILSKITIISARAKYEAKFPGDVPKWKLNAFLETQTELTNGNIKNIVALGDSMMEMDAAHHLAMRFQKALIKTVKFREFPKPNELVKQLNLVIMKFDEIINNSRNLTIRLEKKQGQS